jgi:hypothetical protein
MDAKIPTSSLRWMAKKSTIKIRKLLQLLTVKNQLLFCSSSLALFMKALLLLPQTRRLGTYGFAIFALNILVKRSWNR